MKWDEGEMLKKKERKNSLLPKQAWLFLLLTQENKQKTCHLLGN